MLIRLSSLVVLVSALIQGAAFAQDAQEGGETPEAAVEALEAQSDEPEAPSFDPEPFLNSMIALRTAGMTCDPFVSNNPAQRTEGVVGYFEALGQALPDLSDQETQASLRRFIGSQAAMLCQNMLDEAFANYFDQATSYEAGRPEEWPAAPAANPGPWCQVDYCLDR